MKRMLVIIMCCLLLAGCTAPGESSAPAAETTVSAQAPTIAQTAPAETAPPETTGIQEHFITLYAPNEDATGFIYASWELPEIRSETICSALIEAGVLKEDVTFNSLLLENGQINLDVNSAFLTQLMSYGTAGEYMMVGSVVNTLLSIYAADTVFVTCEGQIMESGHVVYDFPLEFHEDQTPVP